MKMIKTLIIEDEKPAARKLERQLRLFPDIELVATVHSVKDGLSFLENSPDIDLIFSDIVLGDGLSFDIFEKIEIKSFIIYITAFDNYTLRAFKLNSIDYLLKPVAEEDLIKALDKYKNFLPKEQVYNNLNFNSLIKAETPKLSRILAKIGYNLKIIPIEEISYFYSENKMVYAQTLERAYPTEFTLDELEGVLEVEKFFRVNRQFIIQLDKIKNIHTSPYYKVEMLGQKHEEISVSRDRVRFFKEWLS